VSTKEVAAPRRQDDQRCNARFRQFGVIAQKSRKMSQHGPHIRFLLLFRLIGRLVQKAISKEIQTDPSNVTKTSIGIAPSFPCQGKTSCFRCRHSLALAAWGKQQGLVASGRTGRNECLGRIKIALMPKSGVGQFACLPCLNRGRVARSCRHPRSRRSIRFRTDLVVVRPVQRSFYRASFWRIPVSLERRCWLRFLDLLHRNNLDVFAPQRLPVAGKGAVSSRVT